MNTIRSEGRRVNVVIVTTVAVIAIGMMVAGCAGNYGHFSLDTEVGQAFRSGSVQSEYRYYYAGRDNMPYAIIGIDRSYSVPSRYWIPFEPDREKLRDMSGNMYGKQRYQPYGSHILGPDGNPVGVWYSSVRIRSVTVDPENRTVEVLFKNPESTDRPR